MPLTTVSGKLVLAAGAAISLILVAYTSYNGFATSARVREQVMDIAQNRASWAAGQVEVQLTEATAASAALAGMIEGYLDSEAPTTAGIIGMLHDVPHQFDALYSSWMAGLPDGTTDRYIQGAEGRNAAGIFTPYWTKNASGGLDFVDFAIDEDAEWFAAPIREGRSIATEPYKPAAGPLMTSVTVPVRHDGQIVGLVGVDITLQNLASMMAGMQTFEGGRMTLVDSAGKWVAAGDPALLSQPYADLGADVVTAALADGQPRVIEGFEDGTTRLVYPFSAKGMNRTWATILDVPAEVFTTPVHREVLSSTLGGVLILLMALGTIFLTASRLVRRPLSQMLETVNGLATGQYGASVPGADRSDEMGAMARAVETLRQSLIRKDELEAEQERLREAAEIESRKRAEERELARQQAEDRRLAEERAERAAEAEARARRDREEAEKAERARALAQVVDRLAGGLRGLADGNLDVAITEPFTAAYDPLRVDFNNTAANLTELVQSISLATQEINGGAGEISRATTDLSRQTETTAATLEQTAAALNELTASVQAAAHSSGRADALVRTAAEKADGSMKVVEETVTAMEEIKASSVHISKIIEVIDDIAFQTNLLALNAGVEAARAGEAGRGFAVVASEVRELAQRSAGAAREINDLISKSGDQVINGVALVGRTGEALKAIHESITVISSHVGDIAASATEQSSGIGEINTAVNQLDRTQQQNVAAFEETSAACTVLNRQALELAELVGRFRLADGATAPHRSAV